MAIAGVKLVASIDIGTSYSSYAWSFLSNEGSEQTNYTWRTKSSILLGRDSKFIAYGDGAEEIFTEARDSDDGPILIRSIKKDLYNNPTITRDTVVADVSGRHSVPVLKVLTMSMWYLKNHLMKSLNVATATYSENEVHFILTVPAIWNNKAKAMMRLAAINADIIPERLTIALDAECASLYCQSLATGIPFNIRQKGTQYVLVDIGGGTADIAVHQSVGDQSVLSLHHPCGGNWGGSTVEGCFRSYLGLVFGPQVVDAFIANNSADYLKLINNFELKKMNPTSKTLSVAVPKSLLIITRHKSGFKSDEEVRKHIALSKICQLLGDEMIVELQSLKKMFDYSLNSVVYELSSVLKGKLVDIKNIIVVGGLAQSIMVQDALTEMLHGRNVAIPSQCNLAVVKGALLYGKKSDLIRTRVVKLTYGIKRIEPYDDAKHNGGEVEVINGVKMCTNAFHVLLNGGTSVKTGQMVKEDDKPLTSDLKEQMFEIFTSGKQDCIPKLTSDETVNKEAEFRVPLPFGCLVDDKKFERCSMFGGTEVKFKVTFQKGQKESFTHYLTLQ